MTPSSLKLPLLGKTYSLYGGGSSSDSYYNLTSDLADSALQECPDIRELLAKIRSLSRRLRLGRGDYRQLLPANLRAGENPLALYTPGVHRHLRDLGWVKWISDPTLATRENQYHLYMLEIELVNRLNSEAFQEAKTRIALLPHCMRDFSRECQAADDGMDLVCRGCSEICWMRRMSDLLRDRNVTPYIWMNAGFKEHYRKLTASGQSIGILGVACIPELTSGMRSCLKLGIPVVGVPLDANRCARWMGEFHENTVNLGRLEKLIFHHRDTENTER